jgi:hypothetical protein
MQNETNAEAGWHGVATAEKSCRRTSKVDDTQEEHNRDVKNANACNAKKILFETNYQCLAGGMRTGRSAPWLCSQKKQDNKGPEGGEEISLKGINNFRFSFRMDATNSTRLF